MRFKSYVFTALLLLIAFDSFSSADTIIITNIEVVSPGIKTKHSVIIRELSFKRQDFMSWDELVDYEIPRSEANLKNLNLFNQIYIHPELKDGEVSIEIHVVEKWYLWPIPFVEFADRNFNQWSTFDFDLNRTNVGLYVFKYNLFGYNHTLKTTIGDGYTRTLGLEYRAPYIDRKKRLGFTIDARRKMNQEVRYGILDNREQFFRTQSVNLIKETSLKSALVYRKGLYTRHTLSIHYSDITVDDTVVSNQLNPDFLFHNKTTQQMTSIGYHISYDSRNNRLFPLVGIYADAGITYNYGAEEYVGVGFDINVYRPLPADRLYSGLSYTYGDALNQDLPYVLNKAIGVGDNIRGYEQYLFVGDQYALLRAELRYLWFPERDVFLKYMPVKSYKTMPVESYLSVFYDQAQVIDRGLQTEIYGFGVGINTLIYYDKVFRFEYSWNHWNRSGLKVHFKKAF